MYSKTVDGETDIMVGYDPKYVSSSGGYELFVTLENGEEKLFGPYETHSELHAAVESFCNDQVKLGIWIRVRPVKLLASAYRTKLHECM